MFFNVNTKIQLNNGQIAVIKEHLGSGAQGDIYRVQVEMEEYALKLYKKTPSVSFMKNLEKLVSKKTPSRYFIWPIELVDLSKHLKGYLMPLIPKHYVSFVELLNGSLCFKNLDTMITWAINIVSAFQELHMMGYSYQDLNDGSFFLDPSTGDACICDCDNVSENTFNQGILGKIKYMAPEIIRQETVPDIHSDRYSMAIILYQLFMQGHPMIGEHLKKYFLLDEKAEFDLFGENPVYIYHKNLETNRPIRGYHHVLIKRWAYMPNYIKEAFHEVFTCPIEDRTYCRLSELKWIKLFQRYRNELVMCPFCKFQYVGLDENGTMLDNCIKCHKKAPKRVMLKLHDQALIVDRDKRIYEPFIDKYSIAYHKALGIVITNKLDHRLIGIKNLSSSSWLIEDFNGKTKVIDNDKTIPIVQGLKIVFSNNAKAIMI
jgi:DNA-binding helix-hairpin-helix protein with protein kinase domain